MTKAQRGFYLSGDEQAEGTSRKPLSAIRGEAAAERLRGHAHELWGALRREGLNPTSPEGWARAREIARAAVVNHTPGGPVNGSFLAAPNEGSSDPVRGVESGVSRR